MRVLDLPQGLTQRRQYRRVVLC